MIYAYLIDFFENWKHHVRDGGVGNLADAINMNNFC
jgi:hypothetical protein